MTAAGESLPVIRFSVQLPGSLRAVVDTPGEMAANISSAVKQSVDSVLARLGVPGTVQVTLDATGPETDAAGRLLRFVADGEILRYPDELLQHAWCYIEERPLDPRVNASFVQARLAEYVAGSPEADETARILEFLSLVSGKAVELEPARLFGAAQCRAYAAALETPTGIDEEWLTRVLRQVLDLHIAIANRDVVGEVVAKAGDEATAVESVVDALRRDSIDIHLDKSSLRDLTIRLAADSSTLFLYLREGLFNELGAPMPRYRFVIAEHQRPGSFAFRINDFVSVPLFGLRPGQVMVNDTAERLRDQGFEDATPISNPATGQPNSLIDVAREHDAQAKGLTTWNQLGHLILSFAEFLRRYGWCTVDRAGVREQMRALSAAFPVLVKVAASRHSDHELTALLRALVRDRVSVQNLRAILESVLDFGLAAVGALDGRTSTRRIAPNALAHVRTALGPAIAHQAARGTDTVVVYLIDPAIERLAVAPPEFDQHAESILMALRKELTYLPPTAQVPCVLTAGESRQALQRLMTTEHPRMSVIAHEELPPGRNVQPIARLAL